MANKNQMEELTSFQEVKGEIQGIDNIIEFDKRCHESGCGEFILVDSLKVRINTTHPEITATIIEAILELDVTVQHGKEDIHAGELEYSRGGCNKCNVLRSN